MKKTRIVIKYLCFKYLIFCGLYFIYGFYNNKKEVCGQIQNKYSVPWVHKGGVTTFDNYIYINNQEIKATNNIFYKYNIGDNVCINYTTNYLNIHQAIGLIVLGILLVIAITLFFAFIFNWSFKDFEDF